jgi:hypothetical protein
MSRQFKCCREIGLHALHQIRELIGEVQRDSQLSGIPISAKEDKSSSVAVVPCPSPRRTRAWRTGHATVASDAPNSMAVKNDDRENGDEKSNDEQYEKD